MHSIHPLAEEYRNLTDAEYQALKTSIEKHGQQHPIHVFGEQILDGRHRYRACRELGIAPLFEEYAGDDLEAFIHALNDARRHETKAERDARMDAALAKVTTKNGRPQKTASYDAVSKVTQEQAAKDAGVSRSTLQRRKAKLKKDTKVARTAKVLVNKYDETGKLPEAAKEVAAEFGSCEREASFAIDQARTAIDVRNEALAEIAAEREAMYAFITKEVEEKVRYADRYRNNDNAAPLTDKEFKTLLFSLHPDQTTEARRAEALTIVQARKAWLTVDGAFRKAPPPLPSFEDYKAAMAAAKKAKKEKAA